ncbi:MAG: peptidylprolyl isomerase [Saprospiraceae bacterium]|nr:peptidylprolyl isomerase [Saprospiraceae bacterium]
MKYRIALQFFIYFSIFSSVLKAQTDPVLFKVANTDVMASEFEYIYKKTNGKSADFTQSSLREYLDLYTKFKMKVAAAKDMRLDTISALQKELEGYRRQLSESYLSDKEVNDKLVAELYDRLKQDIEVSHILVKIKGNTTKDSLDAFDKISKIKARLDKGERWEILSKELSEDDNTKAGSGYIGFLTAILPNGFYAFENAVYNTPIGQVSQVTLSPMGYHLVKILNKRKARGEMEVSHILVRTTDKDPNPNAKVKVDSLYNLLRMDKINWSEAVKSSEDQATMGRDGNLGIVTINRYEKAFEDAVFALAKDGDISAPIQSRIGWHIIKRVSKKELDDISKVKSRLQNMIGNDSRIEIAKQAMIDRLLKEGNYQVNNSNLQQHISTFNEDFMTYKWRPTVGLEPKPLFSLGGKNYSTADFDEFLMRNQRKRLMLVSDSSNSVVAHKIYKDMVSEACMKYEEGNLEKKYPEFKALMREYEEGILLFEITKIKVWDKASQDTIGLEKFYEANKGKYMWDERAKVQTIVINALDDKVIAKAVKYFNENTWEKTNKKLNKKDKQFITVEEKTVEKSNPQELFGMEWKVNAQDAVKKNETSKTSHFHKIASITPKTGKTLNEARGYYIADYQEYLEKEWINELKEKYPLTINESVFNSMIKH